MAEKVVITGGSGLIGSQLTAMLLQNGYEVAHLSRKKKAIYNVQVYEWNLEKGYVEEGALDNLTFLIHLAGTGIAEGRWTEKQKKQILDSRVKTIELIREKLAEKQIIPKAFISASGVSYYGEDTGDRQYTESSLPGNDFLSHVTIEWEKAADSIAKSGVRTVKLRTGIVLSNEGGALQKMALPAKFGFGAPLGSGKQWVPWIHIDDICRLYVEAMENDSWDGVYNAVAAGPVTNEELTRQICIALNKPQWLPNVPAIALKLAFGEMSRVILGGNYVINRRIEQETNFRYNFPELGIALKDIFRK